jgi:hypothetical protein
VTLTIRPAVYGDIHRIAARMSAIDRLEVEAGGSTPKDALRRGLKCSVMCWTGLVDDRPEAMFGLVMASALTGEGVPWLLGTDAARRQARAFLAIAPAYVRAMEQITPILSNHVHRDNAASIRWLTRLGFTIEAETVDIGGQPMRRFFKRP